jgi:flagellar biosynthetic protein FliS
MRGIGRYKKSRVENAPQRQIVLMLFQEAVNRLTIASKKMETEPSAEWLPHLHHVRSILLELIGALDDSAAPDLCPRLRSLYRWCMSEVIAAGRDRDPKHLKDTIRVIVPLMEGWKGALERLGQPV